MEHCSFCGKSKDEVDRLIRGGGRDALPLVHICGDRIRLCWTSRTRMRAAALSTLLLEAAPAATPAAPPPEPVATASGSTPETLPEETEQERYDRERFAQYARNYWTLRVAGARTTLRLPREEPSLWVGRVDGGMVIPLEEGAGPVWFMFFGIAGGPLDDGFVFSVPGSFAYGYRTPTFAGYAGLTFGIAGAGGEPGPLFGGLAGVGVMLGRVELYAEARYELVIQKAGQSFTQYSFGPVMAFSP
jgi:hypothetical protein